MSTTRFQEHLDTLDLNAALVDNLLTEKNALYIQSKQAENDLKKLRNKMARLEKRVNAMDRKLSFARRLYHATPLPLCRKAWRKTKRLVHRNRRATPKQAAQAKTLVSVCIPTYRENTLAFTAIDSVLAQKRESFDIEVLVAVNAGNEEWRQKLEKRYESDERVRILFTEKKGLSVGRNLGITHARGDYLSFLDDDDYLTSGFLAALLDKAHPESDIVCGFHSTSEDSKSDYSYINRGIDRMRARGVKRAEDTSVLCSACGKLYRASFIKKCDPFDEELISGEDVVFWAANYDKLSRKVACVDKDCPESYVRVVTEDSLSRPNPEREFSFFTSERFSVLKKVEALFFEKEGDVEYKSFVFNMINAQVLFIKCYFTSADDPLKKKIAAKTQSYEGVCLNKGCFAKAGAIAFCHNFSPAIDASAMVATKRLSQIEETEGMPLRWSVIAKDMSDIRKMDWNWEKWFARSIYTEKVSLTGKTRLNAPSQYSFALEAYAHARNIENVRVIYSRTMFLGSHIAAYLYKKEHPDVVWYAEFSDPVLFNSAGKNRDLLGGLAGEPLEDFHAACEILPYLYADYVIFTNEVQKEYMLSYCPDKAAAKLAREKALVWSHPRIDARWTRLVTSNYELDPQKINVGFFGMVYARRNPTKSLMRLAARDDVAVHVFTLEAQLLDSLDGDNVNIVEPRPYFEFLNIASRMDYLFLEDMNPLPDGTIPWLPSKLADYLSTDTPVIACCNEGSPLAAFDSEQIVKVAAVDDVLVASLRKKETDSKREGAATC